MINYYYKKFTFYIDGKDASVYRNGYYMLIDGEPELKSLDITWDNFTEIYKQYGLYFPCNCWNLKKGKLISFWNSDISIFSKDFIHDKKEWKHELNMRMEITYTKCEASIKDILDYHDSDLAIKYLVERGLPVIYGVKHE